MRQNTITYQGTNWVNIQQPDTATMEKLRRKYKFHKLDLYDVLSEDERPKMDEYPNYLFLVLHFPVYKKKEVKFSELDIFIGQDYVVMIHDGDNKRVVELFNEAKKRKKVREENMEHGTGYLLYEIIKSLFDACFPIIDDLERELNTIEKAVFAVGAKQQDMLKEILFLKKDIITFRRIIGPQRPVIVNLEHKNKKFLPENLNVYFDDIVDKVETMWNGLENLNDLANSLQDTNESIISHNTNNVIKVLTVFSVIMLPLTLLTGLYGMNIGLPLASQEDAFRIILYIMGGIVVLMLSFFKWKKWI